MHRCYAVLFLSLAANAAALLEVSATVTEPAGDFETQQQTSSVTGNFTLLVTGGTGSAYWVPNLMLQGGTNESNGAYWQIGGNVSTDWPLSKIVGDPRGPANNGLSAPSFFCTPWSCSVPFTFGVPENFTLTLTATAIIAPNPSAPQPSWPVTVTTSGFFDDQVTAWSSCPNELCAIPWPTYTLTDLVAAPVPEPRLLVTIGVISLLCGLMWKRRIAH